MMIKKKTLRNHYFVSIKNIIVSDVRSNNDNVEHVKNDNNLWYPWSMLSI